MATEVVGTFDADLGGTEIFAPLADIFSQPLQKCKQTGEFRERHVFLLTDGAVSNTADVIDLIKANAETSRVHTFGIGNGVST